MCVCVFSRLGLKTLSEKVSSGWVEPKMFSSASGWTIPEVNGGIDLFTHLRTMVLEYLPIKLSNFEG